MGNFWSHTFAVHLRWWAMVALEKGRCGELVSEVGTLNPGVVEEL